MILLDDVVKYYPGDKRPALDHISLNIQPKEFVFLVGKSGAGKSTLIKMLTREETPDSGKIMVGGIDYDYMRRYHIPHLRRRLGVVFQDFKLLPNRTVYENVAFALEIVGISNREIRRTVPKVLDLVGLADKGHKFPSELSGGERQRVAIARSMARQPKILIADEPTGNLDPETSWGIVHLLEEINNFGTTIMVTTHDEKIVNQLRRRVITLRGGKIVGDQKSDGHYDLDDVRMKPQKTPLSNATRITPTKPSIEQIRRATNERQILTPDDVDYATQYKQEDLESPYFAEDHDSYVQRRREEAIAKRRAVEQKAREEELQRQLVKEMGSDMNSFQIDAKAAQNAKEAYEAQREAKREAEKKKKRHLIQ